MKFQIRHDGSHEYTEVELDDLGELHLYQSRNDGATRESVYGITVEELQAVLDKIKQARAEQT